MSKKDKNRRKSDYSDEITHAQYCARSLPDDFSHTSCAQQSKILSSLIPDLRIDEIDEESEKIEGYHRVLIPHHKVFGNSYHLAFEKVVQILKTVMHVRFFPHPVYKLSKPLEDFYKTIEKSHKDCGVVHIQFGMKYRGMSDNLALVSMDKGEIGLGPYEVAIALLSHPKRMSGESPLSISCPGVKLFCTDNVDTHSDGSLKDGGDDGWSQSYFFHTGLIVNNVRHLSIGWRYDGSYSTTVGPLTGMVQT